MTQRQVGNGRQSLHGWLPAVYSVFRACVDTMHASCIGLVGPSHSISKVWRRCRSSGQGACLTDEQNRLASVCARTQKHTPCTLNAERAFAMYRAPLIPWARVSHLLLRKPCARASCVLKLCNTSPVCSAGCHLGCVRAYLPAEELWSLICLDCAEHRMILCTKMSISNRKIRLKLRRTRNLRVLVLRVQGLEPTRNRSAAVSRVHPSHWL